MSSILSCDDEFGLDVVYVACFCALTLASRMLNFSAVEFLTLKFMLRFGETACTYVCEIDRAEGLIPMQIGAGVLWTSSCEPITLLMLVCSLCILSIDVPI